MHETRRFLDQVKANVDRLTADADLHASARSWLSELTRKRYVDTFTWLGRPVIQLPQDLLVVQEIMGYLPHEACNTARIGVEYMEYDLAPYPPLHGALEPQITALDATELGELR